MKPDERRTLASDCLICNGRLILFDINKDRHIFRCEGCGLLLVEEGLYRLSDGQSIYESYESIFYIDGNEKYYEDGNNIRSAKEKLEFVRQKVPSGSQLLDIGAGFGFFLKVAQESYNVRGLEVSRAAVEWSRINLNVNCEVGNIYSLLEHFPNDTVFDAITLWDVIEHLHDAPAALSICRAMLRPCGQLYISTPDAGSLVARFLGRRWHYIDPIQHIALFNRRNISYLLEQSGFMTKEFRTVGHYYNMGYIIGRLRYLSQREFSRTLTSNHSKNVCSFWDRFSVYIRLGDVMMLRAERID